jgi:type IV pilus assembly protein PilN
MIRINLLPVRAEKKKETLRQQALVAIAILLALGAAIATVHLTLGSEIDDLQARVATRRAEITRLRSVIGEVKEFKKKKQELEEKIQIIGSLEAQQRGPVRVLDELARIIPKKVWIERLKDSSGALALEGVAIDNQTIARFMTLMQSSPWFRDVRLQVTRQVSRGGVSLKSFSIRSAIVYQGTS